LIPLKKEAPNVSDLGISLVDALLMYPTTSKYFNSLTPAVALHLLSAQELSPLIFDLPVVQSRGRKEVLVEITN
jgi:hypothetical protein